MAQMECRRPTTRRNTARRSIETVFTARCRRIIPVLGIGMIFFAPPTFATEHDTALAAELAAEGAWPDARREALRILAENPDDEAARLLSADAALHLDPRRLDAIKTLDELTGTASNPALRARAAYRAGQAHWTLGDLTSAWNAYAVAFQHPANPSSFLESGCAMFLLRREDKSLGANQPELLQQLATCRDLWSFPLRDKARVARLDKRTSARGRFGAGIVSFYRAQIRPAIGERCSLEPSCSEYFLQASRAHGWLGIPMIGDRLVREPGVVQRGEHPVDYSGRTHYLDPLSAHSEWLSP